MQFGAIIFQRLTNQNSVLEIHVMTPDSQVSEI